MKKVNPKSFQGHFPNAHQALIFLFSKCFQVALSSPMLLPRILLDLSPVVTGTDCKVPLQPQKYFRKPLGLLLSSLKEYSVAGLNKSSCLSAALGVTIFIMLVVMNLVTLNCATYVRLRCSTNLPQICNRHCYKFVYTLLWCLSLTLISTLVPQMYTLFWVRIHRIS